MSQSSILPFREAVYRPQICVRIMLTSPSILEKSSASRRLPVTTHADAVILSSHRSNEHPHIVALMNTCVLDADVVVLRTW